MVASRVVMLVASLVVLSAAKKAGVRVERLVDWKALTLVVKSGDEWAVQKVASLVY